MTQDTRIKQEAAEDVFYGQEVINWARWFVIFAGLALVMIAAETTAELAIGITPVVGLMVVNFYLHGRRLIQKPANAMLIGISSVIDLALITAVVVIGPGGSHGGLGSQFYVTYFPVVAAFAFVMPRRVTLGFTALAVAAYSAACMVYRPGLIESAGDTESLLTRVVVMAAIGGLGTYFWRVQRNRRVDVTPVTA